VSALLLLDEEFSLKDNRVVFVEDFAVIDFVDVKVKVLVELLLRQLYVESRYLNWEAEFGINLDVELVKVIHLNLLVLKSAFCPENTAAFDDTIELGLFLFSFRIHLFLCQRGKQVGKSSVPFLFRQMLVILQDFKFKVEELV
jgi:hypothetical protein